MKKLRIYLDTSVINFLYADDAPEKRTATQAFFERSERHGIPLFISRVVIDEITRTRDAARRAALLDAVLKHGLRMLHAETDPGVEALARAYQERGALPVGQIDDALHVALCTVHQIDVLTSWNFRHLANVNRERKILAVNESLGFVCPLRIVSPEEVVYDE